MKAVVLVPSPLADRASPQLKKEIEMERAGFSSFATGLPVTSTRPTNPTPGVGAQILERVEAGRASLLPQLAQLRQTLVEAQARERGIFSSFRDSATRSIREDSERMTPRAAGFATGVVGALGARFVMQANESDDRDTQVRFAIGASVLLLGSALAGRFITQLRPSQPKPIAAELDEASAAYLECWLQIMSTKDDLERAEAQVKDYDLALNCLQGVRTVDDDLVRLVGEYIGPQETAATSVEGDAELVEEADAVAISANVETVAEVDPPATFPIRPDAEGALPTPTLTRASGLRSHPDAQARHG